VMVPRLVCSISQPSAFTEVTAMLVVPWESRGDVLSMAVTSVKADGWEIEHTNLGTITLTDLGRHATRVAGASHAGDHPDLDHAAAFFDRFVRKLQARFQSAP